MRKRVRGVLMEQLKGLAGEVENLEKAVITCQRGLVKQISMV